MKTISITLLLICLSTGYYYEQTEPTTMGMSPEILVRRYQMECIEETRVDPDIIVSIKSGKWRWQWNQLGILKDWALCVLMKNKIMTKEGVYKIDVALSRVPWEDRDLIEKLIDKCLTPKAVPAGEIALTYIKCFQRKKSNYSYLVSAFR